MKRFLLAASIAIAAAAGGVASAADLGPQPYYSTPSQSASRIYNWAGFYAGANIGYAWGAVSNASPDPSGVIGGAQGGFNWQQGQFVYGLEGEIGFSGADDTFAAYKFANPWFGTARGRLGYAFGNILAYATGGLAFGDLVATSTATNVDETKTEIGWTLGVGGEYGFAPNWSAKVEYLYMDLGNRNFATTGADNGYSASLFRVGLNYHF